MTTLSKESLMPIFLTALVTALGTLLILPFSITLGFWLNDYLARPILSVEYAELIPEASRVPLPSTELTNIVQSSHYRSSLMKGQVGRANMLMTYLQKTQGLTSQEVDELKDMVKQYMKIIDDRESSLNSLISKLNGKPTDEQLREIALSYAGPAGQYMTMQDQSDTIHKSLSAQIKNELSTGKESKSLAMRLLKKIDGASSDSIEKIRVKISILNRGNTDGLIRGVGKIHFIDSNLELPIRTCLPPRKKNVPAIMVTLAEELPEPASSKSVGKIEKRTMTEFCYEIDRNKYENVFIELVKEIASNNHSKFEVLLNDHENKPVTAKACFNI
jgi:hypothetical protein